MKSGEFVEIDYVGKVALTGEIFDVTNADEAKKLGQYDSKIEYKPELVIVGQGMAIRGVEKQIEEMNVGDEREFSVMPDEAFGKRHPELIKIIPMKDFIKQKINPIPGVFVTIDGKQAKIQSVSAGRIRVDFNHPLAGRELSYKLKVVRKLSEPSEMAQKYLSHYGIETSCSFSEGKLSVKTEDRLKNLVEKLFAAKLKSFIPEIKEILYDVEKKTADENKEAAANSQEKPN